VHRLLIVSNRLPITIEKRNESFRFRPSVGGLATSLSSFYKSYHSIWIGWPGLPSDKIDRRTKRKIREKLKNDFDAYPVFLSRKYIEMYYSGYCNKTIWPLFHGFMQYAVYDKYLWESYKLVNKIFCNRIMRIVKPNDTIWIHDYHLMLLPKLIREKLPKISIGFFLHIPFPSYEIFRLLPSRKEILEGILGADLIGFHTYDYARHFLSSIRRLMDFKSTLGRITVGNRVVKVDSFPMGIDYKRFADSANNPIIKKEINRLRIKLGNRRTILSIDRLDYTKGIPQRLLAFDAFLDMNPQYREKITLVLVAVPSRTKVEHYRLLKKELDELIGQINGKYGTIGWVPIWYLYRSLPFHKLAALYNVSDVCLVTPLRDGMNLIAKEFIATKIKGKGVLILSEMAGAAHELCEAIIVNPNDRESITNALKEALIISDEEQRRSNKIMQERLQRYNVVRWAKDFMEGLSNIKTLQQTFHSNVFQYTDKKKLIQDYRKGKKRLNLLDYDGTLVAFSERPEKAYPDVEIMRILKNLTSNKKNEVVIISGRNRKTLEKWFGNLNIGLVAEHGAWFKEIGRDWENIVPLSINWKESIRPILEFYVDRTPGSFIEEKEFALVWHYRKADPELSSLRAKEQEDTLMHLTANLNLKVLEGNKVIEIKDSSINKGKAAFRWISKKNWDFILAIGDDRTDEDIFATLPETAYSIKVGLGPSQAKFYIESIKSVRALLKEIGGL